MLAVRRAADAEHRAGRSLILVIAGSIGGAVLRGVNDCLQHGRANTRRERRAMMKRRQYLYASMTSFRPSCEVAMPPLAVVRRAVCIVTAASRVTDEIPA